MISLCKINYSESPQLLSATIFMCLWHDLDETPVCLDSWSLLFFSSVYCFHSVKTRQMTGRDHFSDRVAKNDDYPRIESKIKRFREQKQRDMSFWIFSVCSRACDSKEFLATIPLKFYNFSFFLRISNWVTVWKKSKSKHVRLIN